ncbi:MAG: photosynthetic reaction centre cytochrome c subunit [Gemmatimonadetes bacterium]|nr:photosynthetic reaction centre cytochrome c subunit [Gemmatimonadota bacterium]
MRRFSIVVALPVLLALLALPALSSAQAAGKFPPDSLINIKVLPKTMPVTQVLGVMRTFAGDLGVRCAFCHVVKEGQPLAQVDFASDERRTKQVARQMMLMVQEINRRVDTLPGHTSTSLQVSCATCHRGVSKPAPLATVLVDAGTAAGADSAVRAYKALRTRYYGRAAYDFGEVSLNSAALRLAQAKKFDEATALLNLNEEQFPGSSGLSVFRGNVALLRGDTTAAEAAFREAVRRDPKNEEAKGRLTAIGKQP